MTSRRKFLQLSTGVAIGSIVAPTFASEACDVPKWDEEVDIIIVGSGFAGLSAAINCKKRGFKKVVVLDKMQVIGGNSAVNGGWLAIPKNPVQLAQGVEDSPKVLVQDQVKAGRGLANEVLLTKIADNALDVYKLCIDAGVQFKKDFNLQVGGHSKARAIRTLHGTGGDITTKLYELALKLGVEFRLQNYVEDFIKTDKKVLGILVKNGYRYPNEKSGVERKIKVNKGVIVATGGYAFNLKLRGIMDPSLDPTLDCTNAKGATGEVMLAAMSNGALPVHLNLIQTGHWGSPDEGGFGWSNALLSISWHQGMTISVLNGKRFMDERGDRLSCSTAIMKNRYQDGKPAYPLAIVSYAEHKDDDRVIPAVRDKMAWVFNSLDEISKRFNVPLAELQESVKTFNKQIVDRKDPDFNRDMSTANEIKAPFLVSRVWPKVHYCMGGLKTDNDARVLSSMTLEPMQNIYAIGEVTGGIHGATRLSSTSCLECLAMGFVVANTIQKDMEA